LPGHNYTGPYNPLEQQLKCKTETGEIIEIYQQPADSTDAVAMQHDVDYSSCAFRKQKYGEPEKKYKNAAYRKMVKSLDSLRGKKDNGSMHSRGTLSFENKNLVGLQKIKPFAFCQLSVHKKMFSGQGRRFVVQNSLKS